MAASPTKNQSVAKFGEQELIRGFFSTRLPSKTDAILGVGDDCAILKLDSENYRLISTDQLLEGIHFLRSISSPEDIGHKAAAVNFSDIAAMGGRPTGIFLSLGLPSSLSISWLKDFMDGFNQLCEFYEVPLLGGDTTGSGHDIVINVTVLGSVKKENVKLRSDAQAEDLICVSGTLGDAAAGLQLLQDESKYTLDDKTASFLARCQCRPIPPVEQGEWLGAQPEVYAMIDLSDGLTTDGQHIAEASELGMHIQANSLPLSQSFKRFTAGDSKLRKECSLAGGEDYHLLCTVSPEAYGELNIRFQKRFNSPLFKIGMMKKGNSGLQIFRNEKQIKQPVSTFNHFTK